MERFRAGLEGRTKHQQSIAKDAAAHRAEPPDFKPLSSLSQKDPGDSHPEPTLHLLNPVFQQKKRTIRHEFFFIISTIIQIQLTKSFGVAHLRHFINFSVAVASSNPLSTACSATSLCFIASCHGKLAALTAYIPCTFNIVLLAGQN